MPFELTPGRPLGRSGVLLFAFLLAGCEAMGVGGGETVVLDSTEVSVEGAVHDVRFAGAGATDSVAPARVEAEPGDVVRFVAGDRRPHAVTFAADSLEAPLRRFLEETEQLRGPPLVSEGAAWVISLERAPAGRYPFYCRSHDRAHGVLLVREDE